MHGVALVAILACVVFGTAAAQDAGLSFASGMHGERERAPPPGYRGPRL